MTFFTTHRWSIFSKPKADNLNTHFPSLDAVFKLEGNIISSSDQSEIFAQTIGNNTYFIKRYFKTKGFVSWLGLSRLQTETKNQLWFNKINLPAAEVVAYGEERLLLKVKRGVLITQGIDNVTDLSVLAEKHREKFIKPVWRNQLIEQLAQILKTLHSHHFCHNDMHWRNVLIQENRNSTEIKAYLIDCPSGRRQLWPFLNYKILKDLANIDKFAPQHLSRTQRLKFFYLYRGITKLNARDKKMVLAILQHKANRIKRKAREKVHAN